MNEPFTLLKIEASKPYHTPLETLHSITVSFAKKSSVKFNKETLEVQTNDIFDANINFRVGDDMAEFIKGLRGLADFLECRTNL